MLVVISSLAALGCIAHHLKSWVDEQYSSSNRPCSISHRLEIQLHDLSKSPPFREEVVAERLDHLLFFLP